MGPFATALTVGGGWVPFTWGAGLPACAEEGPHTFSHTESVKVTVVDAACRGDRFRLLEAAGVVGYTSLVAPAFCPDAGDTEDPDVALAAGTYSSGAFTLPAGAHSLNIQTIANPHGAGLGFIRVDAAPANPCTFGTGAAVNRRANTAQSALTINGGWTAFTWGTGVPACSPEGPFTFTATAQVDVKVTTVGCRGAALKVYSQAGALLQTTPTVPIGPCPGPGDTTVADTAFADAGYSHAAFTLPAGTHALAIEATPNLFGGGTGSIRVDGDAGTVGGKNLTITTGNPDLRWDGGTAQVGYYVVRAPITPPNPVQLLGPIGPTETSYNDATVLPSTLNCYLVAPVSATSTLGLSDLLCAFDGLAAGTAIPGGFTLGLNQSSTATLSWTAPAGGADSYALVTLPLFGGAPTSISLPGTAASTTHATGGLPMCYVLVAFQGAANGSTNLLCGIPGVATLASAMDAFSQLQSTVATGALSAATLRAAGASADRLTQTLER